MARCKTPAEIKEELEQLQAKKEELENQKEKTEENIASLERDLEYEKDELNDLESELESIEDEIYDLENYEDPRSKSEQREDATRAVSLTVINTEYMYWATLGKSAKEIKDLCYEFWPDGTLDNESLENVDWDEIEEDCKDPDDKCDNCGKQADGCNECLCAICDNCQEFEPCSCEASKKSEDCFCDELSECGSCIDTREQPINEPTKVNPFKFTITMK